MVEAISAAKNFVHFEIYDLSNDVVGNKVADAMKKCVANGVHVRLLYDAIGSFDSADSFYQEMIDVGMEVLPFRPLAPWRKRRGLLGRNHRKNLVIDGRIAFTGGMNVRDDFSVAESGDEAWRDTHVRLEGPAAQSCNHFFLESWQEAGGEKPREDYRRDGDEGLEKQEKGNRSDIDDGEPDEGKNDGCECIVVAGRGSSSSHAMRELYELNLKKAKKSVQLSVPYFVPPHRLLKGVLKAARRGVRIDLLVPEKSDIAIADWLRDGLYPKLLRYGIYIHEYTASMLHAKTMVIDDEFSVIGSANFDHLSITLNWELSVLIEDEKTAKAMRAQFDHDLKNSRLIPQDWEEKLPFYQRGLARVAAVLNRRM